MLPRAAPVLLRHLGAYAELAAQDLASSRASWRSRLSAIVLLLLGLAGSAAMACVAIVAANWDTPHRMTAIYSLLAFFASLGLVAALYNRQLRLAHPPMFGELRREWRLDQVILARVVAGDSEPEVVREVEVNERQD